MKLFIRRYVCRRDTRRYKSVFCLLFKIKWTQEALRHPLRLEITHSCIWNSRYISIYPYAWHFRAVTHKLVRVHLSQWNPNCGTRYYLAVNPNSTHTQEDPGWRNRCSDLATDWMTEDLWFDCRQEEEIRLFPSVQTDSRAHSASYSMGKSGDLRNGKTVRAWSWPLISN